MIKRFCQGVAHLRPGAPKYETTWDPAVVLSYFRQLPAESELSLLQLSQKLATLLALATGQRQQTLCAIRIDNIVRRGNRLEIEIPKRLKTSKPGKLQPTLYLPFFVETAICPARCLLSYLETTAPLRGSNRSLFVITCAPFGTASPATIARWIKETLAASGVDRRFTAHSTRHAATSAADRKGLSLAAIQRAAGWGDSSRVFASFYNRPLAPDPSLFATRVFNSENLNCAKE